MNIKHKPQHASVKFEDLKEGQEYAITLNPTFPIGLNERYSAYIRKQITLLLDCVKDNVLILYPEISPIGRVHFHGYLHLNNIEQWAKDIIRLCAYGTVCVKQQFEVEGTLDGKWHLYCLKQQSVWLKLLKDSGLRYPFRIDNSDPFNIKDTPDSVIT